MAQPISSRERAPLRNEEELHIAKRLRELRSAAGVSQAWIADTIGVHTAQVGYYEAGRTQIPEERLFQIAAAMGVAASWFRSNRPIPVRWRGSEKTKKRVSAPSAPEPQFREIGKWLKTQREVAGLSQRELAARVEVAYYTFISQVELGRGRIPLNRLSKWADALHINRREFAKMVLRHYEPELHAALFNDQS